MKIQTHLRAVCMMSGEPVLRGVLTLSRFAEAAACGRGAPTVVVNWDWAFFRTANKVAVWVSVVESVVSVVMEVQEGTAERMTGVAMAAAGAESVE